MVTLPDFVKATNSNGSAFYVSTAVCSRIDYVNFVTRFCDFLKDPMGYEETFDQVFQKQFSILVDYFFEVLKNEKI